MSVTILYSKTVDRTERSLIIKSSGTIWNGIDKPNNEKEEKEFRDWWLGRKMGLQQGSGGGIWHRQQSNRWLVSTFMIIYWFNKSLATLSNHRTFINIQFRFIILIKRSLSIHPTNHVNVRHLISPQSSQTPIHLFVCVCGQMADIEVPGSFCHVLILRATVP